MSTVRSFVAIKSAVQGHHVYTMVFGRQQWGVANLPLANENYTTFMILLL